MIAPSSIAQRIWVMDDDRVFCCHGKPYAFTHTQINLAALPDAIHETGMAKLLHFSDENVQVVALDYSALKNQLTLSHGEFIAYRHFIDTVGRHRAHEISAGIQLLSWQKSHQFCGYCGSKTHLHHKENALICSACHQHFYPKIQPCVIIAITRPCPVTGQPQILLAQHHRHKDTGMYGLIAGFMEVGESAEMTIHREILEETGITVSDIRYVKSQAWPYPTNLMLGFLATYQSGEIVIDEDELSHACFFGANELPLIPKSGTIAHDLIKTALSLS